MADFRGPFTTPKTRQSENDARYRLAHGKEGGARPLAVVKQEPDQEPESRTVYDCGPAMVRRLGLEIAQLASMRSQLADALKANVALQEANDALQTELDSLKGQGERVGVW